MCGFQGINLMNTDRLATGLLYDPLSVFLYLIMCTCISKLALLCSLRCSGIHLISSEAR